MRGGLFAATRADPPLSDTLSRDFNVKKRKPVEDVSDSPTPSPFTKGQRVTLSANPTIQLTRYEFVKPMASVTFEIGDDPVKSLEQGEAALRQAVFRSILLDLNIRNELAEFLGDEDTEVRTEDLAAYLLKKVDGDVKRTR